jgi:hypothetical protein
MEDHTLVQSSFSAMINAPIEKIDIPSWCCRVRIPVVLAGSLLSRCNYVA